MRFSFMDYDVRGADRRVKTAHLWFYLGVPVAWTLYSLSSDFYLTQTVPSLRRTLFAFTYSLPVWWFMDLGGRAVAKVPVVSRSPWPMLLLIGAYLGVFAVRPLLELRLFLLQDLALNTPRPVEFLPLIPRTWQQLGQVLAMYSASVMLWIGAAGLFAYFTGVPRYVSSRRKDAGRPTARESTAAAVESSGLGSLLSNATAAGIIAVEAQDHYVQVHTREGHELVLYRFRDALRDLKDMDGLQVHRSHWVRRSAVERVAKTGKKYALVLPNDLQVPVSRSYLETARREGLLDR